MYLLVTGDGDSAASSVLGKGILHIAPEDFAKQMTTMKIVNGLLWRSASATSRCSR